MQINYNDNPWKHPSKAGPGSELRLDIKIFKGLFFLW